MTDIEQRAREIAREEIDRSRDGSEEWFASEVESVATATALRFAAECVEKATADLRAALAALEKKP